MEGVCDPPMRKVLTRYGAYDECFSEFIRVTTEVLPYKTLLREVPELENGGLTPSGCPCRVQLLGDSAIPLKETALRAVELGAKSIDLNFGCPSRFVHHGGSMLLKEPELLHEIVSTVREALDPAIFLSVKIRTGFLSHDELPNIIDHIKVDGVNEIIIHARTRKDLYKKEGLYWPALATIKDQIGNIALVANGDIISKESSLECYKQTQGIDRQMIGRAAFAFPNLPQVIKELETELMSADQTLEIVWEFANELINMGYPTKPVLDRIKQFLGYVHRFSDQLDEFFQVFCRIHDVPMAQQLLHAKIEALKGGASDSYNKLSQAIMEQVLAIKKDQEERKLRALENALALKRQQEENNNL